MTISELGELPIKDIAEDNAVRHLQIAFKSEQYSEIEIKRGTSKGYLLPVEHAKKQLSIMYIVTHNETDLAFPLNNPSQN
jgi:hypothetical protein